MEKNNKTNVSLDVIKKNPDIRALFEPISVHEFSFRDASTEYSWLRRLNTLTSQEQNLVNLKAFPRVSRYGDVALLSDNLASTEPIFHANLVKLDDLEFIASQSPTSHNLEAFFSLLWTRKTELIILLCERIELGSKCLEYWPQKGELEVGAFKIETLSSNTFQSFARYELKLQFDNKVNIINLLHLTDWPDHAALASSGLLILNGVIRWILSKNSKNETEREIILENSSEPTKLFEILRKIELAPSSPILVQCSAGIGRTGSFISATKLAKDILVCLANDSEVKVSVMEVVRRVREQRWGAVQTETQYNFLYEFAANFIDQLITA